MRIRARWFLVLLSVLPMTGCTDRKPPGSTPPASQGASPPAIGGQRPVEVMAPPGYAAGRPAPLLLMLHGYDGSAGREESYLHFTSAAAEAGMLYALPEVPVSRHCSCAPLPYGGQDRP